MFIFILLGRRTRKSKKFRTKFLPDDYVPKDGEVVYGCWTRSECFKVERGILTFGFVFYLKICITMLTSYFYIFLFFNFSWGRWPAIIQHNDFREGWKESDVEDLARIVVSNKIIFKN